METKHLKKYAPKARRDFIQAVTDRAAFYGLTQKKVEPVTVEGDFALILGRPFPKKVAEQRKRLERRIERDGFDQVMEAMAYTWFNRLVAIRFMEIHGYLDHGYRVLSHPEGKPTPEILEHAEHLDLPGLDKQRVIDLKLDGTKESELYRLLLTAQCNALHNAMPFLFERIDDETELLLPDNLLHSDSLIRELVGEIPEENWQEVEIIGWLYQFYISEKKDQVIGKVVKSEDIPAATQLFTPNWIVKYMVQNSLGRQWMATYPNSPLRDQMEFYIEPAEQTPEVQKQLDDITPDSLNPEELTLLDPACGSGHILVEAYDLFKAIYQEKGYRSKDIPRLILEKNLFGLEIDDRAAQLASLALLMKARSDDRRIFEKPVRLNVRSIQESKGLDAKRIADALNTPTARKDQPLSELVTNDFEEDVTPLFKDVPISDGGGISESAVRELIDLFLEGKTFGSLIRIPATLVKALPVMAKRTREVMKYGEVFDREVVAPLQPILHQALILAGKFDAVVANPPYMGGKGMAGILKSHLAKHYPTAKSDLFACFIERGFAQLVENGYNAMVAMQSWMFLSSFEDFREALISKRTVLSMAHLGPHAFDTIGGQVVQVTASVTLNRHLRNVKGAYLRLIDGQSEKEKVVQFQTAIRNRSCDWYYEVAQDEFKKIPGSPIAYWVSETLVSCFEFFPPFSEIADTRIGLITGDNEYYIRYWHEVGFDRVGKGLARKEAAESRSKWFPQSKGGEYRKWYGNNQTVLDWSSDGAELQSRLHSSGTRTLAHNFNLDKLFQEAITWTKISSGSFSARYQPVGFLFNDASANAFPLEERNTPYLMAFLNSNLLSKFLQMLNPTLNYLPGNISDLPIPHPENNHRSTAHVQIAKALINLAQCDWDSFETSWDFYSHPLVSRSRLPTGIHSAQESWTTENRNTTSQAKTLEEENNRLFIEAYGLQDELSPEVPIEQITLTINPAYRYGGDLTEEERWARFQEDTMKELISYAIGCMMGRYSLDKPGLVYAQSGNEGFDSSQYVTFPADEDGIVPITETAWFEDDAAHRLERFIATAWDRAHLEENLKFIAESLDAKKKDRPREVIRRYLSTGFYKHHLSIYKKRPIYWLFSSGKQKAFQCLVYLHRYNEGTLARMRTEYVIPLQGKMSSRIAQLESDIAAADSTAHRKALENERKTLTKQLAELQSFDETLRHFADQRITLDLDDGVKVNYGKFGDLLAEVKAVTGEKAE